MQGNRVAGRGGDREEEPIIAMGDEQVDQQHGGEVGSIGWEAADVHSGVLDLPPARVRCTGVAHAAGDHFGGVGQRVG
jgi:hypothetical protein